MNAPPKKGGEKKGEETKEPAENKISEKATCL